MLREDEEYEFSLCSEDAIRVYYPDYREVGTPLWNRGMMELQVRLLKCKRPTMYPSDRKRADRTLRWLRECMRAGAYV